MVPDPHPREEETQEAGRRFAAALTQRDFDSLQAVFHPGVRSRLLIPSGLVTPLDAKGLIEKYREWLARRSFLKCSR